MSLVVESREAYGPVSRGAGDATFQEYAFLIGRHIDTATLARACTLAARWGVHPHDVLIANGWIGATDYYRALAEAAHIPFYAALTPGDAMLPPRASPRQCLAAGLLKERARAGAFVIAPERLRPNALRTMLAELGPDRFALATPRAVRNAVYHHFAPGLARNAIEALATRRPDMSARRRTVSWQRVALVLTITGLLGALLLAPFETVRALTLLLAVLFVPVIGLRAIAAWDLMRGAVSPAPPLLPPVPDAVLPTYTILVPLYREAHMVVPLVRALMRLDWPALGSNGTKPNHRCRASWPCCRLRLGREPSREQGDLRLCPGSPMFGFGRKRPDIRHDLRPPS